LESCLFSAWQSVVWGNIRGVALIEAESRQDASFAFQRQYAGQFSTIEKIEKLG
jgi:hypothetical protein